MADETTTIEAPENETQNTEAETNEEDDNEPISKATKKKLDSENKNLRERLRAAESRLQTIDNASKSEQDKLKEQAEELKGTLAKREATARNLLLMSAVESLKPVLGVRSSKSMLKLIDADALEFDLESGTVEGVADELKRLKKEDPDLFISGGTDGGAGGNGRGGAVDMNSALRKALGGR